MIAIKDAVESIRLPAGKEYLRGCDKCQFGRSHILPIKDAWALYPTARTLPNLLLVMFRDGLYAHCDCDAGNVAAQALERAASQLEANEIAMRETVARSARSRLERIFDNANVPNRFADLTWNGWKALAGGDAGKHMAIKAIDAYAHDDCINTNRGKRVGIMLYGKSDMGKTGALSPLFLHYIRQGLPGLWVQYNDLLAALKQFEDGKVEERVAAAKHTEFLFIDDFGDPSAQRQATDYAREVMFRIIDHRNNYQKPTFITSNLTPAKLADQFGERLVKRLDELCLSVEVTGTAMGELMDDARVVSKWDNYPPVAAL